MVEINGLWRAVAVGLALMSAGALAACGEPAEEGEVAIDEDDYGRVDSEANDQGGLTPTDRAEGGVDPAVDLVDDEEEAPDMDASAAMGEENVAAAVADPNRPEADRARDEGRKPAEILNFFGIEPGMSVYEVGAGGGYYTHILSNAVGADGKVYAQYSEGFWERLKETAEPRIEGYGNVETYVGAPENFDAPAGSVDAVLVVLIWHHMHYNAEEGDVFPSRSVAFLENARRVLKPGGVLGIIEHQAADGSTRKQAADWHRTPKQMTIDDVTAHGFEFVGASDALANPDDDLKNYWREALPERDSSQRYVLKFVRSESA